jgi:hypothetical protein
MARLLSTRRLIVFCCPLLAADCLLGSVGLWLNGKGDFDGDYLSWRG